MLCLTVAPGPVEHTLNWAPLLPQDVPPLHHQYPSSAPTALLDAFNQDNIAALRSSSSYAQLNPVLKGDEGEFPQLRFILQEDPVQGARHDYSEVALAMQPPSSGAGGEPSSRRGLPLQEAMKGAPAMSREKEEMAAHPYFNLSKVGLCVCVRACAS